MGYHKKIGDTVYESHPNGNTFYHANGTESSFFQSDFWCKNNGTDERLFEVFVNNEGKKLFRFNESRLKEMGFEIKTSF